MSVVGTVAVATIRAVCWSGLAACAMTFLVWLRTSPELPGGLHELATWFGISFALALVTWLSRMPWREIGCVRPRNWIVTLAVGLAFGIVFKLLMKAVVMPLLGAAPISQAYHFLAGKRRCSLSQCGR